MNIFERVKEAVSVKQAAEHYGLKVRRNGMVCCPFHEDRHPSMKLNEDYYYCFGCGAHGDVIELTARLFDLTAYEAACKLEGDFGLDPDKPPEAAALRKPNFKVVKGFRQDERDCQRVVCDYLHVLEDWEARYAPSSPGEEWDERFVEACRMIDYVEYLADILIMGDSDLRAKTAEKLIRDGTIAAFKQRLNRRREEKYYGDGREAV